MEPVGVSFTKQLGRFTLDMSKTPLIVLTIDSALIYENGHHHFIFLGLLKIIEPTFVPGFTLQI